ncbi:HAD family hydrolase [Methylovirgula sp. 4M-Z18]|uniref:HAD family hydrolase n=1 Tax=Methylovirgula sp. 4M-Z18 TaxID=2293567 RepID=UPI000E2EB0D7|nr:HAD-IA family hydrolase [Methylovirgula sp. 4M-Z18]RFB81548.1 HAD family hydrolase [Methylovirgula sp. 4M-Z18]
MRLVIFDLDGTLINSAEMIVAAKREAFAAVGWPAPPRAELLGAVGLSVPENFRMLAGAEAPYEEMGAAYKAAWTRLLAAGAGHELFAGAAELIDRLSAAPDATLGIATGNSRRGVARILAQYGWERCFATIQTAEDAPSKPAPAMILHALQATGIAPSGTAMIGDTSYDMAMARAAGVQAIGVAWGYHEPDALRAAGAHDIVETFDELAALLAA